MLMENEETYHKRIKRHSNYHRSINLTKLDHVRLNSTTFDNNMKDHHVVQPSLYLFCKYVGIENNATLMSHNVFYLPNCYTSNIERYRRVPKPPRPIFAN